MENHQKQETEPETTDGVELIPGIDDPVDLLMAGLRASVTPESDELAEFERGLRMLLLPALLERRREAEADPLAAPATVGDVLEVLHLAGVLGSRRKAEIEGRLRDRAGK